MPLRPPTSTLFPYTTLFRSLQIEVVGGACSKQADELTATQAGSADGKFHVIDNVTRHDAGGACHTDACDVQRRRRHVRQIGSRGPDLKERLRVRRSDANAGSVVEKQRVPE